MNNHYITCRKCGANNNPTAQRCTECGTDLKSLGNPSADISGAPKRKVFGRINSWITISSETHLVIRILQLKHTTPPHGWSTIT